LTFLFVCFVFVFDPLIASGGLPEKVRFFGWRPGSRTSFGGSGGYFNNKVHRKAVFVAAILAFSMVFVVLFLSRGEGFCESDVSTPKLTFLLVFFIEFVLGLMIYRVLYTWYVDQVYQPGDVEWILYLSSLMFSASVYFLRRKVPFDDKKCGDRTLENLIDADQMFTFIQVNSAMSLYTHNDISVPRIRHYFLLITFLLTLLPLVSYFAHSNSVHTWEFSTEELEIFEVDLTVNSQWFLISFTVYVFIFFFFVYEAVCSHNLLRRIRLLLFAIGYILLWVGFAGTLVRHPSIILESFLMCSFIGSLLVFLGTELTTKASKTKFVMLVFFFPVVIGLYVLIETIENA